MKDLQYKRTGLFKRLTALLSAVHMALVRLHLVQALPVMLPLYRLWLCLALLRFFAFSFSSSCCGHCLIGWEIGGLLQILVCPFRERNST